MQNIKIIDETIKCLGQSNNQLSFKDKLEIIKCLDELKVNYIELPYVLGNKKEEILVKTACTVIKNSAISIDVGKNVDELDEIYSLISCAKNKRLVVSVPISPVQMEYSLAKKPKAVLELLKSLVVKAVSLSSDVEVVLLDATRAESSFIVEVIKCAIDCGAKTITFEDSLGSSFPCDYKAMFNDLFSKVQELKNVNLAVRCSDEFSLGVADIFASIESGVTQVKLCAGDIGVLPDFNKTVLALDNLGSKKGYSISINKTATDEMLKEIAEILSKENESNVLSTISNENNEIIDKNISQTNFSKLIKLKGFSLNSDELKTVYEEFKRITERKDVSVKELTVIISTIAVNVPKIYKLINFSVQSSNVLTATASITLSKEGKEISALSFGNGAVDAAFRALEQIVGRHFELDDFELGAITEGKEAMGQTIISLRNKDKIYSGRGVSTDIIGASIRAYVDALNKIVYEENK